MSISSAAQAIQTANNLLITAGAGLGVDSGLPDFRGNEGFWKAYPPFAAAGLTFSQVANPRWFAHDAELGWGFYGHRHNLYRQTIPHAGFDILKRWAQERPTQIYTSNVDGQFQRAGFEDVCEIHGSILHLQCAVPCSDEIWSTEGFEIEVDPVTFRATSDLPHCPRCGALARPNILMFSDRAWVGGPYEQKEWAIHRWLKTVDISRLTIIEIGAGTAIPSVRIFSEYVQELGATLIRLNPRESQGPRGTISLALGAKEALEQINTLLKS